MDVRKTSMCRMSTGSMTLPSVQGISEGTQSAADTKLSRRQSPAAGRAGSKGGVFSPVVAGSKLVIRK